jgi:hypothetical protein
MCICKDTFPSLQLANPLAVAPDTTGVMVKEPWKFGTTLSNGPAIERVHELGTECGSRLSSYVMVARSTM